MARVREKGWLERNPINGMVRMKTNAGTTTNWTYDEEAVRRHIDHLNNEDGDGHYFEVPDEPTAEDIAAANELADIRRRQEEAAWQRRQKRRKKEQQRVEANRKSKRSDDKYVFVISCVQRKYKDTLYYMGDHDLFKMGNSRFASPKVEKAKVFTTKASAQKVVDMLEANFLVSRVFRNLKVVRKDKKIFGL